MTGLPASMLAACADRHGGADVLAVREVPLPKLGARQLLVRVHAAAINPKDIVLRAGRMRPLDGLAPFKTGYDWAGTVVARGARAPQLPIGARLFGMLGGFRGGACAQYLATDYERCAELPNELDFEHASALPLVSLTALQALRDVAGLQSGQRVLINGAAGGVGSVAVQLAKVLGAHVHATASPSNHAFLRSLGADEASDYREFARTLQQRFDLVFDVFGTLSFARVQPALTDRGMIVTTLPRVAHLIDIARTALARQKMRLVVVRSRRADLMFLTSLLARGALRPVIDRVLPLSEIAEAHRYLGTKHAHGKVVLRVP